MKELQKLTPGEVEVHPKKVLQFSWHKDESNRDYNFCWIKNNQHLVWAKYYWRIPLQKTEPVLSGGSVLEIPLKGLPWFVQTLEEKFFKHSSEGGLPAGEFGYAEIVEEEELSVSRMFGEPGYCLHNFARTSHDPLDDAHQKAYFSDEWLFELGLLDQLKELSMKIENGEI